MKPINKRRWIQIDYEYKETEHRYFVRLIEKIRGKLKKRGDWARDVIVFSECDYSGKSVTTVLSIMVKEKDICRYMKLVNEDIEKILNGDAI